MMWAVYDGNNYIGLDSYNSPTTVRNAENALVFETEQKATNYKNNIKATLKKFNWNVVPLDDCQLITDDYSQNTEITKELPVYVETELEKNGFQVSAFFEETVNTVSNLPAYVENMKILEQECNDKIVDARHYKRDNKTKLNAIQLQRLEQFEIAIERERYKFKSNRLIAEIFLADLSRLKNINYIKVIQNIKTSEYKPRVLSYEALDEIVGKTRNESIK